MLDLEERLTRHYRDVATAPSLHRRPSIAPRLVFAGVLLAMVAAAVLATGLFSSDDNLITTPSPDTDSVEDREDGLIEEGAVDPELLRLMERTPYNSDGMRISSIDMTVVRQGGSIEGVANDNGVLFPEALGWAPSPSNELFRSFQSPELFFETYGYRYENIERSFEISNGQLTTFVVLDTDATAVLDRAPAPSGSVETTRSEQGSFDVLDWGDEFDMTERTDVRPLGETGQFVAFDGNTVFSTIGSQWLEPYLATDNGAPTLADQRDVVAAIELAQRPDSLGFMADLAPSGQRDSGDGQPMDLPTITIVQTSLDQTSRVVLGFTADTDLSFVESRLQEIIGDAPEVDTFGEGFEMQTVFSREGEFIVIDFEPAAPVGQLPLNATMETFMSTVFSENPDILS